MEGAGGLAARGLWPPTVQESKGTGALQPSPAHTPPPLFALAPAHIYPKGPSCQEISAPELQTWGPLARLGAQELGEKSGGTGQPSSRSVGKTPVLLWLPGPQFPPRKLRYHPAWAGCLPCTGTDLTSSVPWPTLPPGARLSSAGQWGPSSQPWSGEEMGTVTGCIYPACHQLFHSRPQHICTEHPLSTRHQSRAVNKTDVTPDPTNLQSGGKGKTPSISFK